MTFSQICSSTIFFAIWNFFRSKKRYTCLNDHKFFSEHFKISCLNYRKKIPWDCYKHFIHWNRSTTVKAVDVWTHSSWNSFQICTRIFHYFFEIFYYKKFYRFGQLKKSFKKIKLKETKKLYLILPGLVIRPTLNLCV